VRLYQTNQGIAREENDELAVLDVPHPRIADCWATRALIHGAHRFGRACQRRRRVAGPGLPGGHPDHRRGELPKPHRRGGPSSTATRLGPSRSGDGGGPPFAPIILPAEAPTMVDYEGEIAVLIGRAGRDIPSAQDGTTSPA